VQLSDTRLWIGDFSAPRVWYEMLAWRGNNSRA
jgi:hypothetical protein